MLQQNRLIVCISGITLLTAALMLLVLPLQWLLAAAVAALWHELCHYIAVKLCGGAIRSIRIGSRGCIMECTPMCSGKKLACSLAGPIGSFLLLLFINLLPRTAICGFVHGLYNLTPIYPLDGGRALHTAAFALWSFESAEKFCTVIEHIAIFLILIVGIVIAIQMKIGLLPLLLVLLLLLRFKREKLLANWRCRRYNRPNDISRLSYDRITAENSPNGTKTGPVHGRGVQ